MNVPFERGFPLWQMYHQTLQLPSPVRSFLDPFSTLFCFRVFLAHKLRSHQPNFQQLIVSGNQNRAKRRANIGLKSGVQKQHPK